MDNPDLDLYRFGISLYFHIIHAARKIKMYKHSHNKTFDAIKSNISKDDRIISLKDGSLKYLFVNHAFEQLFSKSEKEITGCSDLELVEPEFAENWRYTDLVVLKQNRAGI